MKASCLRAYLGGIILNTMMYEKTVAGYRQSRPTKNTSNPPRPSDAGAANARKKPKATQGIRCHQMGTIAALQAGQFRYGGPISMPGRKSTEQLGQADHAAGFFGDFSDVSIITMVTAWRFSRSIPSVCLSV
jgi:hypothetical protein